MIRLSANLSKKVPIPGADFSSQQYGASMEVEVSDTDKPEIIQERVRQLYGLLSATIDEQIAQAGAVRPAPKQTNGGNGNGNGHASPPANGRRTGYARTNGNGNGSRRINATDAQQRAIFAICKSMNLELAEVLADYNVADTRDLNVKDASRLIDELKSRQTAHQ